MSGFANTVFTLLVGWFQTVVSLIWSGLTDKNGNNLFTWIGNHWIVIVVILCAIGSVVDLSVYIARWKPFDVIRSYFERKKGKISPENTVPARETESKYSRTQETDHEPAPVRNGYRPLFASNQSSPDVYAEPFPEYIPDNSVDVRDTDPLLQEPSEYRNEFPKHEVPADSPYRRPLADLPSPAEHDTVPEKESREHVQDSSVRPRRRRINVSELFGNPEEDMIHFEPPKPMIDQAEAYHTPVYPRNWKENGDSSK